MMVPVKKTHSSLVTRRLPFLSELGAIKYTKLAIYTSIIDDPETLTQESKDTPRLINVGAEKVLWVQSSPEELKEVLPIWLLIGFPISEG